jgi:hypothetical protein
MELNQMDVYLWEDESTQREMLVESHTEEVYQASSRMVTVAVLRISRKRHKDRNRVTS